MDIADLDSTSRICCRLLALVRCCGRLAPLRRCLVEDSVAVVVDDVFRELAPCLTTNVCSNTLNSRGEGEIDAVRCIEVCPKRRCCLAHGIYGQEMKGR